MNFHRNLSVAAALLFSATAYSQAAPSASDSKPAPAAAATPAGVATPATEATTPEQRAKLRAEAMARRAPKPPSPEVIELRSKLASVKDVTQMLGLAASFDAKGDFEKTIVVLQRVLQLRPMAGNIQYELAAAYAQLDMKRECYDLLLKMQTTGYAYDPSKD